MARKPNPSFYVQKTPFFWTNSTSFCIGFFFTKDAILTYIGFYSPYQKAAIHIELVLLENQQVSLSLRHVLSNMLEEKHGDCEV